MEWAPLRPVAPGNVKQCQMLVPSSNNNGLQLVLLSFFCIFASCFSFWSLFVFIYKRKWKENHSGLYAREGSENRPFHKKFGPISLGLLALKLGSQIRKGLFSDASPIPSQHQNQVTFIQDILCNMTKWNPTPICCCCLDWPQSQWAPMGSTTKIGGFANKITPLVWGPPPPPLYSYLFYTQSQLDSNYFGYGYHIQVAKEQGIRWM